MRLPGVEIGNGAILELGRGEWCQESFLGVVDKGVKAA
jgi:hypothetical protein